MDRDVGDSSADLVRETRATWIGHSTVVIETGGRRFMTDPVLRNRIGVVRRRAGAVPHGLAQPEVVLISHLHHDHLDVGSLRRLDRKVTVVVPAGGGRLVRDEAFSDVREVSAGQRLTFGEAIVEAVPARHAGTRLPFGPRAEALGYVIEGDHRLYFAGDTDVFPGMALLGAPLDLAILPVGGWGPTLRGGHMDPDRAAEALALLKPRYAIAIHWGTFWPIGLGSVRNDRFVGPSRQFARIAAKLAPTVSVVDLGHGEEFLLTSQRTMQSGGPQP